MPSLVGPGTPHKNLKGYLSNQHNYVQTQLKEIYQKLSDGELDSKRDFSEVYMHVRNEV